MIGTVARGQTALMILDRGRSGGGGASALIEAANAGGGSSQRARVSQLVAEKSAAQLQALSQSGWKAQAVKESLQSIRARLTSVRGAEGFAASETTTASPAQERADKARPTQFKRDIVESRDVYETRAIYEEQAVYEEREIRRAVVTGTRNLMQSGLSGWDDAGIREDAQFVVQVGSGSLATVKFEKNEEIKVTQGGVTRKFTFEDADGEWRDGLVAALNSIQGLNASFTAQGRLQVRTEGDESLTVMNGLYSPLSSLGLSQGLNASTVQRTEQVQTGTEMVEVGSEDVLVGTADVVVGQETVTLGASEGRPAPVAVRDESGSRSTGLALRDAKLREQLAFIERTVAATDATDLIRGGSVTLGSGRDRRTVEGADLSLAGLGIDRLRYGSRKDLTAAIAAVDAAIAKTDALTQAVAGQVDQVMEVSRRMLAAQPGAVALAGGYGRAGGAGQLVSRRL